MRKSERHKLYKLLLAKVESSWPRFICFILHDDLDYAWDAIMQLPELWARRPKRISRSGQAWWGTTAYGKKKRIEVLKKAIRASTPKKKKTK